MKHFFIFYLLFFIKMLTLNQLFAQQIVVGQHSSSSANYSGMNGKYKYCSAEFMVGSNEITKSGNISGVSFYKCSGDTGLIIDSIHIYIKESDTQINKTVSLQGYTEVFSGSLLNSITKGWIRLPFSRPFTYTGTKNLNLLIIRKNGTTIVNGYPYFAVSFNEHKEYQAAYFLANKNPWSGSPAQSDQNLYRSYRPYLAFDID